MHERVTDPRSRAVTSERDVAGTADQVTADHASVDFEPANLPVPVKAPGTVTKQDGWTGPGCCSPSGSGILHVWVRYCSSFCGAEYTFNAQTNWSWGGGIPGVRWSTVDVCCTFQWLSGVSGAFYQDGGVVWGLPQYYYDYLGRGSNTGFLSDKAQIVHNCVVHYGCYTDLRPAIDMYVHDDASSYYRSWSY